MSNLSFFSVPRVTASEHTKAEKLLMMAMSAAPQRSQGAHTQDILLWLMGMHVLELPVCYGRGPRGDLKSKGRGRGRGLLRGEGGTFVFLCCMHPRFCLLRIVRAEEAKMRAGEEVQVAPVRVGRCVCVRVCRCV